MIFENRLRFLRLSCGWQRDSLVGFTCSFYCFTFHAVTLAQPLAQAIFCFQKSDHKCLRINDARVAKLADAPDLGSGGEILRGSSPLPGTSKEQASNVERSILDAECGMPSKIASDLVLDVRRSLSDVTKRATSVRANA